MRLIGLHGRAGTGKDTVADRLVAAHGYTKLAFADPMKDMSECLGAPLPVTREEKEGLHPVLGVSWRHIWQELGTGWMREKVNATGWITIMEHRILDIRHIATIFKREEPSFVISDVRFENEADWIRKQGGLVWHIERQAPGIRAHVSEQGIRRHGRDYVIDNSGTIDELQATIDWVLND